MQSVDPALQLKARAAINTSTSFVLNSFGMQGLLNPMSSDFFLLFRHYFGLEQLL